MAKKETEITTVTMDDGRIVEFAGKRKLLKTTIIGDAGVQVLLDFRNGETRIFTIRPDMLNDFAAHGAAQKLGDHVAGVEDPDDMVLAIDELTERLNRGEFNAVATGGSGLAGASILLRALVEWSGKSAEDIKAFLSDKTQAQKVALRNDPEVKPIVERLEAEKAARAQNKGEPVDTSALLGGLRG